jgi:WD40 repeat protein
MSDRFIPSKVHRYEFEVNTRRSKSPTLNQRNEKSILPQLDDDNRQSNSIYRHQNSPSLILKGKGSGYNSDRRSNSTKNIKILNFSGIEDNSFDKQLGVESLCQSPPLSPPPKVSFRTAALNSYIFSNLIENFYFNVIDFAGDNSIVVALGEQVNVISLKTNQSKYICESNEDKISAVKFDLYQTKSLLALGNVYGTLEIWDTNKNTITARLSSKKDKRIGCIDWLGNLIVTGDRTGRINIYDSRIMDKPALSIGAHSFEVCSSKFNPTNTNLIATGGNDNLCKVFDIRTLRAAFKREEHKAAVKAVSWSPYNSSTLVTGGGSGDQNVCIWDINLNKCLQKENLHSQICNAAFSEDEFVVTSHGWPKNNIEIRNSKLKLLGSFNGHDNRVLYMAVDSDKKRLVTGGADQKIKVWSLENLSEKFEDYNLRRRVTSLANLR